MTFEKTKLLTTQIAGDPFSAYASAMKARTIVGELLKFSKGDYFAGLDDKLGSRLNKSTTRKQRRCRRKRGNFWRGGHIGLRCVESP